MHKGFLCASVEGFPWTSTTEKTHIGKEADRPRKIRSQRDQAPKHNLVCCKHVQLQSSTFEDLRVLSWRSPVRDQVFPYASRGTGLQRVLRSGARETLVSDSSTSSATPGTPMVASDCPDFWPSGPSTPRRESRGGLDPALLVDEPLSSDVFVTPL